MPNNKDFRRMGGVQPLNAQFYFEPWVDLPEDIMFKFPSMREWNRIQRLRYEDLSDKFIQLARSLQAGEDT